MIHTCMCADPDCMANGCRVVRNNKPNPSVVTWTEGTMKVSIKGEEDNTPTEELNEEYNSNVNAVLVVVEFLLGRGKTPQELIKLLVEPDTY